MSLSTAYLNNVLDLVIDFLPSFLTRHLSQGEDLDARYPKGKVQESVVVGQGM
jgi:hypothetical protein